MVGTWSQVSIVIFSCVSYTMLKMFLQISMFDSCTMKDYPNFGSFENGTGVKGSMAKGVRIF